jgi:FMN phosphatase YigB (HAD superfamily)
VPRRDKYTLLTFDVFDTCLVRDFVSQESLWLVIGQRVVNRLPGISSPADFVRLRGTAEQHARGQGTGEDITLAQVYERLGSLCDWDAAQRQQAIALEEATEARGLRPNPSPQAQALFARARGAAVSYVTDTPHRADFIRKCLDSGALPDGAVFSSGDLGLRKGTGSLFEVATKQSGIAPRDILHVGNDLRTDGIGTAVSGTAFAPVFAANPTRYEETLDLAARHSGGLLGAALAGAGRNFRLAAAGPVSPALASIVSGVAGPAIFASVAWTLLSAAQDGVSVLYFVARDGEILRTVARLLQEKLGIAAGIECRYLYGSRKAWHLAALGLTAGPDFAAALRNLLVKSRKGTLRNLLAQLDMTLDDAARVAGAVCEGMPADAPLGARLGGVIDALAGSPDFRSLALSRAQRAHQSTISYLAQEGMFSSGLSGLVDIGWHGAASASLVTMAENQGAKVVCYFAGGLCGKDSLIAPQDSRTYLIDARGADPELRPALVHLLETFCAGTGGSTLGYLEADGRWLPRLAPPESNAAMRWGLRDYQELVGSYVSAACESIAKYDWKIRLSELEDLRPSLVENIRALWYSPAPAEAEAWGTFPFEGDSGTVMLGRPPTLRDAIAYLRHLRDAKKRPRFGPWQQAVLARSGAGSLYAGVSAALKIATPDQRALLRARLRMRLARTPVVSVDDVTVLDGRVTVRPRRLLR